MVFSEMSRDASALKLTKPDACDLLMPLQPNSSFLPEAGCGGTKFPSDWDGANVAGRPVARPLSRPSPSANLVGNWKGEASGTAVRRPRSPKLKRSSEGCL